MRQAAGPGLSQGTLHHCGVEGGEGATDIPRACPRVLPAQSPSPPVGQQACISALPLAKAGCTPPVGSGGSRSGSSSVSIPSVGSACFCNCLQLSVTFRPSFRSRVRANKLKNNPSPQKETKGEMSPNKANAVMKENSESFSL